MRELKAQKLLGCIHSRLDGVEPSLCFHTVPYSSNLFQSFCKRCVFSVGKLVYAPLLFPLCFLCIFQSGVCGQCQILPLWSCPIGSVRPTPTWSRWWFWPCVGRTRAKAWASYTECWQKRPEVGEVQLYLYEHSLSLVVELEVAVNKQNTLSNTHSSQHSSVKYSLNSPHSPP